MILLIQNGGKIQCVVKLSRMSMRWFRVIANQHQRINTGDMIPTNKSIVLGSFFMTWWLITCFSYVVFKKRSNSHESIKISHGFNWNHLKNFMQKCKLSHFFSCYHENMKKQLITLNNFIDTKKQSTNIRESWMWPEAC